MSGQASTCLLRRGIRPDGTLFDYIRPKAMF
jgi:hypothetical protein